MVANQSDTVVTATAGRERGLFANTPVFCLIRSGYGLLILVLEVGAYLAVTMLGDVLRKFTQKTKQTAELVELIEDIFEARIVALTNPFDGQDAQFTEVAKNIDGILSEEAFSSPLG